MVNNTQKMVKTGASGLSTETQTKEQQEYTRVWHNHIDGCNALMFTPSRELSKEVVETLEKLKELVVRIAKDKKLGEEEN